MRKYWFFSYSFPGGNGHAVVTQDGAAFQPQKAIAELKLSRLGNIVFRDFFEVSEEQAKAFGYPSPDEMPRSEMERGKNG